MSRSQSNAKLPVKFATLQIALVWFSGVQYYTGQFFDVAPISQAAHQVGALMGLDLAHAIGNVELKLAEWEVDFAVWCSYK